VEQRICIKSGRVVSNDKRPERYSGDASNQSCTLPHISVVKWLSQSSPKRLFRVRVLAGVLDFRKLEVYDD
jgi:hypothetical protein